MSQIVTENHRKYCALHGYKYQVFEQNLAAPEALPYWSKIGGIRRLLDSPEKPEWIVWMDDDAIVTNPTIKLQDYIQTHGGSDPNTHVIVSEDSMSGQPWCTDLNTGVLMVRNSDVSRSFFKALWDKRIEPVRGESYTYGTCPNQRCLHEQQAMHDLLRSRPDFRQHVSIIPQRDGQDIGMNVFRRFSHYDYNRDMRLDYGADPSSTRYKEGDFIAQCTGLATAGSRYIGGPPKNLRLECVNELIQASNKYYSKGLFQRIHEFIMGS
jgi:hypothetical protein